MKKKKMILTGILSLLVVGLVSAGLLQLYGTITTNANVNRAIPSITVVETVEPVANGVAVANGVIENNANVPILVELETLPLVEGIETKYSTSVRELILDNKNPSTWERETTDTIEGTLLFNQEGETFDYTLNAIVPESETQYVLIYYADRQDRYVDWGGDNPGYLFGISTSDADGNLQMSASLDLEGMDLPAAEDWNGDETEANYCLEPDYYVHCHGAKIWLIPASDYNPTSKKLIAWNPNDYLFETDLISYTETANEGNQFEIPADGELNIYVMHKFSPAIEPGEYELVTSVLPSIE